MVISVGIDGVKSVADLLGVVIRAGADRVIDTRKSTNCRRADFTGKRLEARMGNRYVSGSALADDEVADKYIRRLAALDKEGVILLIREPKYPNFGDSLYTKLGAVGVDTLHLFLQGNEFVGIRQSALMARENKKPVKA